MEQARPLARANPIHSILRSWVRWAGHSFDAGKSQHAILAWCIAVVLPTIGVLLVYWLLVMAIGWPVAVLWNIVVLYVTLGFRQFSHHFTEIRQALETGDEERARQLLAEWQQVDVSGLRRSEIVRQVIEYSVIAAHRHVFGVLAWFSILSALGFGPAGAVLYRLSEFVPRYWMHKGEVSLHPVSEALQRVAARCWAAIDWLPARITAIGFAVVGSFEEAIESWRNLAQQQGCRGMMASFLPRRLVLSIFGWALWRIARPTGTRGCGCRRIHCGPAICRPAARGRAFANGGRVGLANRADVDDSSRAAHPGPAAWLSRGAIAAAVNTSASTTRRTVPGRCGSGPGRCHRASSGPASAAMTAQPGSWRCVQL